METDDRRVDRARTYKVGFGGATCMKVRALLVGAEQAFAEALTERLETEDLVQKIINPYKRKMNLEARVGIAEIERVMLSHGWS